jgi:esterase FrsA
MTHTPQCQSARPQAATLAARMRSPDHYAAIQEVPPEIAVRLPGFAAFGIDGETLVEAVRAAGPEKGPATPGWVRSISTYGDAAFEQGEQAEARGMDASAHFLEASFWYFFARFPHITSPAAAAAYRQHRIAYHRAAQGFDPPLVVVMIPFEDGTYPGYLRVPAGNAASYPAVIIWGGIDVWKSDLEIHSQSEALLRHGIATFAIDMPGTGESPIPVGTDAERVLVAAWSMLRANPRIDGDRIGCYGLSFGGYWAVKLAIQYPELAGAVQIGGPVHETFQPSWVEQLPLGTRLALARVLGLDPRHDMASLPARLGELSLVQQQLLPAREHAPLLSVDGMDDELVPISEFDLLTTQGVHHDQLIFAHDRHVASRNWRLHEQFVADWFAQRFADTYTRFIS